MNRRERRAAFARSKTPASHLPAGAADPMGEANRAYRHRQFGQAELICKTILARAPAHGPSLNLLGLINQSLGRHRLAIKMFAKAITFEDQVPATHYNIACSYQELNQLAAAATHFKKALALGMSYNDVEVFLMQNPVVIKCKKSMDGSHLPITATDLFDDDGMAAVARDIFLRSALESTVIRGATLEFFLTHLRSTLVRLANANFGKTNKISEEVLSVFCALAQQCFINEYILTESDEESQQARQLRERLQCRILDGGDISPLTLAAVAAYFPLHSLEAAKSLVAAAWPECVSDLLRQQVREPLEEAEDHPMIPALTTIENTISKKVMQQYEENPYPRWITHPLTVRAGTPPSSDELGPDQNILVAGCGTGQHALDIAQCYPKARILAVDVSRASLAYARRKTREAGVQNIEYAQADLLNLGAIGRRFDRVEAIGVLHHLSDPAVGWRTLLSLLRPDGIMRIGLYSEAARRSIVEARALVVQRGYRSTAEGIRALRREIICSAHERRWQILISSADDFYSMSGCRDLFFNVMEHRFTIAEIATFLNDHGLLFLGFELPSEVVENFQQHYPGAEALFNLSYWSAFEAANQQTFRQMYVFSVCKMIARVAE